MSDSIIVLFFSASSPNMTGDILLTSAGVNVEYNGVVHYGVGDNLISVTGLSETDDLPVSNESIRITISTTAELNMPRNVECQLDITLCTPSAGSATLLRRYRGFMSGGQLVKGNERNDYSFAISTWRDDADRGVVETWDEKTQKRKYPGDEGLDAVAELAAGQQFKFPHAGS